MDLTPALILSMWAGGMAAGASLIAAWKVVGVGYLWLAGGVVAAVAAIAGMAADSAVTSGSWAWAGAVIALVAVAFARRPIAATVLFGAAAVALLGASLGDSPLLPALSGTVFMGAVSSEMMLGHWYLVDPTLPRWPLLTLDAVAGLALVADFGYVAVTGPIVFSGADGVFGMAYVALAGFTTLLIVGVWFSLREPTYSGVMSATGLSYLAVLTTFGVVTLGRVLVTGGL